MTEIAPARIAAFACLSRIELQSAHSDEVIHSAGVTQLDPRDRNLVTEITYGTLRWRGWLDRVVQEAVARSWERVEPKARILLRMSAYQLTHMDRVPAHAVVHDAVEIAKRELRRGAAGFVNGVLRALERDRPWIRPDFHRDCPIWNRISLPRWLWQRWEARYGADRACEFALALNQPAKTALRARNLGREPERTGPQAGWKESDLVPSAYLAPEGTAGAAPPEWRSQDEASQLIPFLFGPLERARVWDVCAAPGGKSAILREMCGPGGWVVSSDLVWERARRLREMIAGADGAPSDVLAADAGAAPPFRGFFDAVLADVPCSGLGTLRRNPEIKWRIQPGRLESMSREQGRILRAAAATVRPGGRLLYSTCSTEPEENESVVDRFLAEHHDFRLLRPDFPQGIARWLDNRGLFRSFPGARLWDGFFAALIVRET